MIIKEKLIFWILLPIFAGIIVIGVNVQEKKKLATNEFLKDIESVTEKARAKKKVVLDNWDLNELKKQATLEGHSFLIERDIFLKPVSETKDEKKEEVVSLKEEVPKKNLFIYKGRMRLGDRIIVIIEDENTGKSFSVKEGDTVDNFTVLKIGEKEIQLKKKDGEEILIPTVKEEVGVKPPTIDNGLEGINEKK